MKNCATVNVVRTAIGNFNGSLVSTSTIDLGTTVIKAAIERAKIDSLHVDEVIMGSVLRAGLGQNPARQVLLKNRLAETVCGFTVDKMCGSGLKSVAFAAQTVQAGQTQSIVTGGMGNMSLTPYSLDAKARSGYCLGDEQVYDVVLHDGLMCATHGYHMGITAGDVAKEYGVTHEVQGGLALHSQRKAAAAIESGAFTVEIVLINAITRGKTFILSQDGFPKADSTTEALSVLRPALDKAGTVTVGNASGINDGVAALVIMEESSALVTGLIPLTHIKDYVSGDVLPALMGMGPVPATQKALQLAGLQLADVDLIEANKTFVAQFLAVGKILGSESEKANASGGVITLGHPIGTSDARILVTLLHAMQARGKALGLATLCVGDGQGIAMVIGRLN